VNQTDDIKKHSNMYGSNLEGLWHGVQYSEIFKYKDILITVLQYKKLHDYTY